MFPKHRISFNFRLYNSNKLKLNSIGRKLARNQIHEQKKTYNNSPCTTRVTTIHNIKNPISHQIKFKQASINMQIEFLKLQLLKIIMVPTSNKDDGTLHLLALLMVTNL
jgi:hypothetical protein